MNTLTPEQMDALGETVPVVVTTCETAESPVTLTMTPAYGGYVVASTPFEVLGAPESYPSFREGLERLLECSRAVTEDRFPPARQAVAA